MKSVVAFAFVLCFGSLIAEAQNWQCIRDSTTTCFVDHTLWTIQIDSVKELNGYRYYYGFKSPRIINEFSTQQYPNGKCIDPFGPSRMGVAMSAGIDGNFFFNYQGEAIRFCTDRQPGNPWICCQISDSSWLEAVVSQVTVESVLDIYDSVKTISFQAVGPTGTAIYHPLNYKVFKVSKQYGMMTLYDFAVFPEYNADQIPVHILSGFHSPSHSTGDNNLTRREVYCFSPGDIFCTEHRDYWGPHGGPNIDSSFRIILDSAWNQTGDVVTYTVLQYRNFWDCGWNRSYYFKDTLQISYDNMNAADFQPEESEITYNPDGTVQSVNASFQMRSEINSRWTKMSYLSGWFDPEAPCGDSLLAGSYELPVAGIYGMVEGCGGNYYYSCYTENYDTWCTSFLLKFLKKGDETWGMPFDTTFWVSPNSTGETNSLDFRVFPNPSSGQVTIKLPLMPGPDCRLDIRSSVGRLADRIRITGAETRYDVSHLTPGFYIISLYNGLKLMGNLKFVR